MTDKEFLKIINDVVGDISEVPLEKQAGQLGVLPPHIKTFEDFKREMNIAVGRTDLNE